MRLLLVDHEDSFVYNLYQAFAARGHRVTCLRYTTPWSDARAADPDAVVLSPGPGHPSDERVTGLARRAVEAWAGTRPFLGVCLGHQLLAAIYGARVVRARRPAHGETVDVRHNGEGLFRGVPDPFPAARYHSLVVSRRSVPKALEVTATTRDGVVMSLRHRREPTFGVQFHPESYLTPAGSRILDNFASEARR